MQVSIARSGAQCSALPAAVLVLTHNFTAAQRMQGAAPPALTVLEVHAKDVMEHYELARSLFKKVRSRHVPHPLCPLPEALPRVMKAGLQPLADSIPAADLIHFYASQGALRDPVEWF